MNVDFLSVEEVAALHHDQIRRFGGAPGIRDHGLLESAAAQPQATFGDGFLHDGIFEMAAAYLFHLVSNHPFVDRNKRAGLHAALVFLALNGHRIRCPGPELYELTMALASGEADKAEVATVLRRLG